MTDIKKSNRSKLMSKDISDLLNETQFEKSVPKKRTPARKQKADAIEDEEDISKLIDLYQVNAKKKKVDEAFDAKESRQKLLDVLGLQMEARKGMSTSFAKSLFEVISQLEADHEALSENVPKLEQLAGVLVKCIKQTSAAQKQNLKALKDIHTMFKKECEEMESTHKAETDKLANDLEDDMNKLQQQLVAETKRKQIENLRRTIFHAIQNDFVEGLLTRGAFKSDDRPLWFDVYRRFPPIMEPKFARQKPEIKPLRPILYSEDIIRAKFHAQGQGLGAVNMLNPAGDTHTKKLVKQYEKLQSEGVPENELLEKSVELIGLDRQERMQDLPKSPKATPRSPDSATSQVLAEADLKNIFKE